MRCAYRPASSFLLVLLLLVSAPTMQAEGPQSAEATPRLFVFDATRALTGTREGKAASAKVDALVQTHQAALTTRAGALERLEQEVAVAITAAERNRLQTEIIRLRTELRRVQEDAEQEIQTLREQLLAPLSQRLLTMVAVLAKEKGALAFFNIAENPLVIWYAESADLTSELITRLDASTPAAIQFPGE